MEEQKLYEAHPSMFRNHPIWFVLSVVLILMYGLGLVILLIWWLQCLGTTLTITNERITLRKGILSKHTNEVYHTDVRNVQVSQSMLQRVFQVGKVGVATAGHGDVEIVASGMPDPQKVKNIIDQYRRPNAGR